MLMVIIHYINICSGFRNICFFSTNTCLVHLLDDENIKMIIKTQDNLSRAYTAIAGLTTLFKPVCYISRKDFISPFSLVTCSTSDDEH